MPRKQRFAQWTIAKVRGLLPMDWIGSAGKQLRSEVTEISAFARRHNATPRELADEAAILGRRKLEGLASREHAEALKKYEEAEKLRIEIEIANRTKDFSVRQVQAETEKMEADAEIARINAIQARLNLIKELQSLNVVLDMDEEHGVINVATAREGFPWNELLKSMGQSPQSAIGAPLPDQREDKKTDGRDSVPK